MTLDPATAAGWLILSPDEKQVKCDIMVAKIIKSLVFFTWGELEFLTLMVSTSLQEVDEGIPQGSIIGSLVFTLYINVYCPFQHLIDMFYADDTILFAIGPTQDRAFSKLHYSTIISLFY